MTFKEAMAHYRAGTATEEEQDLVENELEKSRLIAEYLDAQWEDTPLPDELPEQEIRNVRKSLHRRNAVIVLTSLVLAAALTLGTVFGIVPVLEKQYWDPETASYNTQFSTDLEITLDAYTELFCPEITVLTVSSTKTGFAAYDLSIQYWNTFEGGDNHFAAASLERSTLKIPDGLFGHTTVNIFSRGTYPYYEMDDAFLSDTYAKLSALPEYITVTAAVSFAEDKSMAEMIAFQENLQDGQVGWTGIRCASENEQLLPLCGFEPYRSGIVREDMNPYYPCFDLSGTEMTPENLEAHFKSLLQFSGDQADAGRGIGLQGHNESFYTQALDYLEQNGVYSYGCYVTGTPETLLALLDSGSVSQVWIENIRIGF